MTKTIFLFFTLILSVCFLSAQNNVLAQPSKSFVWTNYQIAFQAPTDLAVKESSDKLFYAGNGHVFLNIYPKKGDSLNHNNLPQAVQNWAKEHKLSYSSSNAGYLTSSSRYLTYYLGGTGYRGMSTYAAVIVDSGNPGKSYYVWLQYQNGYADAAMNILNSFLAQ